MGIRTDLALESKEVYEEQTKNKEIPGVEVCELEEEDIKITHVKVLNEEGERIMGKSKGNYITIEIPEFAHYDMEVTDRLSEVVGKNLSKVIKVDKNKTTLVVGLGNWKVTPDSLGPMVVERLMITRHLKELMPDSIDEDVTSVCAISPGVLGITGMETSEIVKGIVDKIKPDFLICIDALASRKLSRLNRTIQISDTGIEPGAGVGNKRKGLNYENLGVPVIAIGVPTVVHAATMTNDTIDMIIDELIGKSHKDSAFYKMLKDVDKGEKEKLIKEVLSGYMGDLVVTPKEVDMIMESVSKIIANGINVVLQPAFELEDIKGYIQ